MGLLFLVGCITNSSGNPVITISGGTATLGRTADEANRDYNDCVVMATRTSQSRGICEPAGNVFGDVVPVKKVAIQTFNIDKYTQFDSQRFPLQISLEEAGKVCKDKGGRLPTKEEWEYAARGKEGRIWPWGNTPPSQDRANIDINGGNPLRPVEQIASHHAGVTPEGVEDMTGNVWQWTAEGFRKGGGSGTYTVFAKPYHQLIGGGTAGFRCVY